MFKFSLIASMAILNVCVVAQSPCESSNSCGTKTAKLTARKVEGDIVTTAVKAGKFNTLIAAAKAAGLVDALTGPGPLTVFAPTDEAFAKLPKGTLDSLLKPENKGTLAAILKYHVVAGKVTSTDVVKLDFAPTLNGQQARVTVHGEGVVMVDNAKITTVDVTCSNGIIHIIDTVILPRKNIAETAKEAGTFKTLLAAAEAAGLVGALTGDTALTVFAPSDEAFAKLPKGTVENLLKPENKEQLAGIIKFHVTAGRVLAKDVVKAAEVTTLNGKNAKLSVKDGAAMIEGAKIVATDILAGNGVIHVIDAVILP